jgi:hypothetical protein
MIQVGQRERGTQNRVVQLFQQQLNYRYLGNWQDAPIAAISKPISSPTFAPQTKLQRQPD